MSNKSRGLIGSGLNKSFELSMIVGDLSGLNGQIRKQNSWRKSSFVRSNTGNLQHHVKRETLVYQEVLLEKGQMLLMLIILVL